MDKVFHIYGESYLRGDDRHFLFSVWDHRGDAEDEMKRLEAEKPEYEFQIEEFEKNQASNEPIF